MKKNVGNIDKIIRGLVAILIAVLYINGTLSGIVGIILLLVAVILVLTSLVSFCPLYWPLGISTTKKK